MKAFRLGTFNCENLFARYRFRRDEDVYTDEGFTVNQLAFDIYNETDKAITAKAIRQANADILCLQEVESLPLLDRFNSQYLPSMKYRHRILIDGNDPRYIDVAVLSRFPFLDVRTHRHERNAANTAPMFSRDCLEVDVDVSGKRLTLYVNHFKSMLDKTAKDGRKATHDRRREQVDRVAALLKDRWGAAKYKGNFAVLGDFNDYVGTGTALTSLVDHPSFVNVLDGLPKAERWTHYWAGGNEYRQLDYILVPKTMGPVTPTVVRQGLPFRAESYAGPRLEGVGESEPKASDHCPLVVEIPIGAL